MATSRMRLSLLVVLLLICFPSFSQVDGIIYDYRNNSEVIVSRKTGGYSGNIVIPESVVMNGNTYRVVGIGRQAFQFSTIESIKIPNSVKEISSTAFQGCNRLTSVTIPNSVEKIGKDAFRECKNLELITLSNSQTSIEETTFYGCTNLKSINIPNSVTTIGDGAFGRCTNLKSVTLPTRLSIIKMAAFWGCYNLESVTTINSMTLDFTAFLKCDKLKEIVLGKDVANIEMNGDIIYNKVVCLSDNPPQIGWFSSNKEVIINELEVPYGHTLDYINAERWKDIAPVIYSNNNGSRYYPVSIIAEGDRVVTINGNYFGAEVKDGEKAVVSCNSNTASHSLIMKVTQNLTPILSDKGTFSFIPSKRHSENVICTYAYPLSDVTLSESGTLMDKIDINNISNIENLKITGNINGTDLLVIRKMENLKLLDLRDAHIVDGGMSYYDNYTTSKNKIGKYFFSNNNKLYTVLLPQDITEICDYALGSSKLRTISIPKSVKTMWRPFSSYKSELISVYIEDLAGFCTIKHIGNTWDCHNLYVEDDRHDLYLNGNELVDLVIQEGVKEISDYTFCYCRGFDSVIIPSSVKKIGKEAFNCRIKDYIICLNQTPPEITNNTFVGVKDITLYVPKGSKNLYWLHPYWEDFKNIVEMDGTGMDEISVDHHQIPQGIYTLNGIKLSTNADDIDKLPKGIYFINGKKVIK